MTFSHFSTAVIARGAIWMACVLVGCSQDPQSLLQSAKLYLKQNDNKAAIIQIKNALLANPNLVEARLLLGNALLTTGDAAGAEAEFRKSLELKQPPDSVVPQLAMAMLAQGHGKALTDEFSETQLAQPSAQASLQNALATAYALQGQRDRSDAALDAALRADPGFAPAILERARKLTMQREFDSAHSLIDGVIANAPKNVEAWKLKGDIYWIAQGKGPQAADAYSKAIAIRPDFLPARNALVVVLLQQGKPAAAAAQLAELKKLAPNSPPTQYLEALLAFQNKDFKAANEAANAALKNAPNYSAALLMVGATELQLNQLRPAQQHLSRALEIQPTSTQARSLLILADLRLGQNSKAMEVLLPALDQTHSDSTLASLAGETYVRNGDLAKAQEYFASASAQDPKSGAKRTSLALVHLLHGATESALGELQDISVSDSGDSADLALISALLHRREYDKALAAIDTLEKKQPTKALPAYLRAQVLLSRRQPTDAKSQLERATAIEPSFFPAVAALAAMDQADKKPQDARNRFNALLAKNPNHVQALTALAKLAASTGVPTEDVAKLFGNAIAADPADVPVRLLLIDFYLGRNDVKGALSAAENAAAANPKEPRILDALGRTQQASGDMNQAAATYHQMAEAAPQSPLPYWRLAEVQLALKDKVAAISSLRKALDIRPDLLEVQRALISLYMSDQKYAEALTMARTVQDQRPRQDVGYVLEGDIHASTNHWEPAVKTFRAGLAHLSTTTLAMKLQTALQTAGKASEADRFARDWQKTHPQDAAFEFFLGDQALRQRDYGTAERYYSAVLKYQPNNPIALNNLAWVSAKLKKDSAIGYAEKAVALAPGQPVFLDTLATLRSDNGDHAGALELQARALALQPENTQLKLNLAKIQISAGRMDLARKTLNELASLGPAFAGHAQVASLQKELPTLAAGVSAQRSTQ